MAKQILVGIEEQNLNEVAHYLVIYFPYNEEMCSYTDDWLGELYENKYPLVSKGMWSGIIDLKVHKLLDRSFKSTWLGGCCGIYFCTIVA
ncbi:MAG: hypothetical protein BHV68_21240 [Bacteroidales bacterium 43_8]|nr:MAG: hypothetical protein BHV68_21240 [Bacteroidales bacterium 43_8]